MIRLMMTGSTWKRRACFVKDVRGKKKQTCSILDRNLTTEHVQGDTWKLQPQQWKWAPTLQGQKQECPQRALSGSAHFFLLPRFCWQGRCEIRPSYKRKVLSNHLPFQRVCLETSFSKAHIKTLVQGHWRESETVNIVSIGMRQLLSSLSVRFGTQWPGLMKIHFSFSELYFLKQTPQNPEFFSPALLLLLNSVKKQIFLCECFQFTELPIEKIIQRERF